LQHPNQSNVENLNDVRRKASRNFRGKKRSNICNIKLMSLKTHSKIKKKSESCIGVQKGYQPRTNIVKDEKGDSVTDSHSILVRWRNHFSQLLNVQGTWDVRQAEIRQNH
jgi:hypothetical protein